MALDKVSAAMMSGLLVSETAPANPGVGQRWYRASTAITYQYTNDGASSFWLDVSSGGIGTSADMGVDFVGDGKLKIQIDSLIKQFELDANFLGKILRIDVDNNPEKYTIPQNNPFIGKKNVKEEILCYGLRNPWRFSFDLLTGDLIIGDVGQNNWEEINVIPGNKMGGQNFGWNIMEGFHCYPEGIDCNKINFNEPIWEYPNNANYLKTLVGIKQNKMDGCSITGGYVYRGNKIPEFYGRYIFGDYCTGKVWSFIYENGETKNIKNHTLEILNSMNKNSFYLSSFGKTSEGELFIVDYNGGIYIITSL